MERSENKLITSLKGVNQFLHILLAIALVVASLMVVWDFAVKAVTALVEGNMAHGFLQALGSLFILWTLSSLIAAEINYVQTNRFYARVFVEVALITVLRELIVQPVELVSSSGHGTDFNPVRYGLLLAALLVIGVVYRLVSDPQSIEPPPKNSEVDA